MIRFKRVDNLSEISYTINDLRNACKSDKIKWSMHALKRMRERHITSDDFKNSIYTDEIIEYYPEDYRTPSCLVSGTSVNSRPLHSVSGYDCGVVFAVTAYFPDFEKWENNFTMRRVNE